ncbi:MAG: peptidase and in, kexin, sedolisin [Frankiales bacterium]|nr:peptidase and in, kexin, sedolisin [Frankiales bacterium]
MLITGSVVLTMSAGANASMRRDPLRSHQWGLDEIHAAQAWKLTRGEGVTVAVIDSGVDFQHPDLQGALLQGKDFTGTGTVTDDCGHGTEVAGVIAARADNGIGIAGVAPRAKILPLRDGAGCTVDFNALTTAIGYAVAQGARVINVSQATIPGVGDALFKASGEAEMQAAIDDAWRRGVLVVAGAGNDALPVCQKPAAMAHVLCVGAVSKQGTRAEYSQGDATMTVDYLVAPGGGETTDPATDELIWTTSAQLGSPTTVGVGGGSTPRGYDQVEGTSFATPFVAGVAALMFSRGMTVQQVHDRLLSTATDLGLPGRDPVYGYGEVDAAAALG